MSGVRTTFAIVVLAFVLACAGPASAPVQLATATPTPVIVATNVPTIDPSPTAVPALGLPEMAAGWTLQEIERGIKPALMLDSSGSPHVAFMSEERKGFVKYARRIQQTWEVTTVSEGYFYGPLDMAIGPDDVPHIVYHDHEDLVQFFPDKGDLAYAVLQEGEWKVQNVFDPGHDGWDGRLAIGSDNLPRVSAIDPLDFNGSGVEYYESDGAGDWTVEAVGSQPITYKYSTSLVLDQQDNPFISFHSGRKGLQLASRSGGEWSIETVDDVFQTGVFSSMARDIDGALHISYAGKAGPRAAEIKYAFRSDAEASWQITSIDTLDEILYGTGNGARNITSIALDSKGRPWIAYSDESVIKIGVLDGSTWDISVVANAGDTPFGQLVSLKLDSNDRPHLAFFLATSRLPLDGVVMYATQTR